MKNNQNKNKKSNQIKDQVNTVSSDSAENNADTFLTLIKKYKRYIAAGALFVAMVAVLVRCTGPQNEQVETVVEEEVNQADLTEEFQIDAIPEINTLIAGYYKAYQDGDVAALETYAYPISDTEKSYIQLFSEYVESYDGLKCYTKSGLLEGEYVVSVYLEMKFKDVSTAAPGLDFFYLRTDANGTLYIDNAYSQFNQSNMENSTEADVQALINEFEQEEDVVALQQEVQEKYNAAIASDSTLDTMANETIPNAINAWVDSLTQAADAETAKEDASGTEDAEDAEDADAVSDSAIDSTETKTDTESGETKENASEDSDSSKNGKAKTAYALDGINLRKGAGTDTKVVATIALGDKLKIYPDTKKDGWVKAVYKKKKGYVKTEYITTDRSDITGETDTKATAPGDGETVILTDSVNVRVSMSETADRVGLAYAGDEVKVLFNYAEGWSKVEWNGQTGYIKTELIK